MPGKKNIQTVGEYIAGFSLPVQQVLKEVQAAIRNAVPDAEETISYQMPAFKLNGWVFYYSAYKHHYSLSCPPPFTVFSVFGEQLKPYIVSKSAIQFPYNKPVPVYLITEMAKFRAKELAAKGNKKNK